MVIVSYGQNTIAKIKTKYSRTEDNNNYELRILSQLHILIFHILDFIHILSVLY